MKTVFITGVAGFVGSNLARELLAKNYNVKGIDNLSQGSKRNIEPLFTNEHFKFYEGDVCNEDSIYSISEGVDHMVHLAAFKIPRYGGASKTLLINTKGTENVLNAARRNKAKVLFSSTSDVYGKNPILPFREDSDLVLGPTKVKRWTYAVSKIYDEQLCLAFYEEYGVPVAIVRYFGGYGPHQHLTYWGGPQSVFINCALKKERMPIHGNGRQRRTFTYISDIVKGTIAAMEKEEALGEIFNIGNAGEIAVIDLAYMIWRMINTDEPLIEFIPYKKFSGNYEDVLRRIPDTAKARQLLGFEAAVKLQEGLRYTIEWQRQFVK